MNDRGSNSTGCCRIGLRADTGKLTNVIIHDLERDEIWRENVRCSSKTNRTVQTQWAVLSESCVSCKNMVSKQEV